MWRRRRARSSIARLARRDDVYGLGQLLEVRDVVKGRDGQLVDLGAPRRVEALEALAQIDDAKVPFVAATALEDDDPKVQLAAVRTLAARDAAGETDAALVGALVRWRDPDDEPQHAAGLELLQSRDRPELGAWLVDRLLETEPTQPLTAADRRAITTLAGDGDEHIDAICLRLAEHLDSDERSVDALVALGAPAVDPLIAALDGPGTLVAVGALGALRSTRAVEPLVDLIGHEDPAVRAAAANALGAIRDPQGAEALLRASLDEVSDVRDAAHNALEALGTAGLLAGFAAFVAPLMVRMDRLETEVQRSREMLEAGPPAAAPEPEPDEPTPTVTEPHVPQPGPPVGDQQPWREPPPGPTMARIRRAFGR